MGWFRKSLLVLGLLAFFVGVGSSAIIYAAADGFRGSAKPETVEKKASAEGVRSIVIRSGISDVHFAAGSGNEVQFRLTGPAGGRGLDASALELKTEDGTLTAEVGVRHEIGNWFEFDLFDLVSLINGTYTGLRLEVALPDRTFETITADTEYGDLVADQSLKADNLKFNTKFGDIELDEINAKSIETVAVYGDIELRNIRAAESVKTVTSYGDIRTSFAAMAQTAAFTSEFGDIEILLPGMSQLRVDLQNEMGRLETNLPGLQYETFNNHAAKGELGSGGPLLSARSSFGKLNVRMK